MSHLTNATPGRPVRTAQDGEQMYSTTVVTKFQPDEYGQAQGEVSVNHAHNGLFATSTMVHNIGDSGIMIRSGDPILGCHLWMHRQVRGEDGNAKYEQESFSLSPEQLVTMGQALIAMGMAAQARAQMTKYDRVTSAVENIRALAFSENMDRAEAVELRKEVQARLTQAMKPRWPGEK